MKGILLLNGEPFKGEIDCGNAVVYCCDGAYEWAHGKIRIDKNIGDFDSLSYIPQPPPEEIYPCEKDFTDGEIALRKLIEEGVDEIEIYGGGGLREDHFIGNIQLLYYAHSRGIKAALITNGARIFAAGGKVELCGLAGKTISLLPFGGAVHIMDSAGLKYAYPEVINYGECRGISNVVENQTAHISIEDGDCALIFINGGKV